MTHHKRDIDQRRNLNDMTLAGIEDFITVLGKERYRARQIMKWVHQSAVSSIDDMTNLAKGFRAELKKRAFLSPLSIVEVLSSHDGTKKILFRLNDGATVESVLIAEKNHRTLCISTQVGCSMACAFCLTGQFGFTRDLTPGEIAGQITAVRLFVPGGDMIRNVVMMGMGEPLLNYDNVLTAIDIITSDFGLGISKRRITVSTCGIVPAIECLGRDTCVNLAVSLNAADDETRSLLMPVNRRYPLRDLLRVCQEYPMPRRRKITFEYILIRDVNDSEQHARRLAVAAKGIHCKFNLIPFNEFPESSYRRPDAEHVRRFQEILAAARYTTTIRPSKGGDILAACGQLSGRSSPDTTKKGPKH